jgi:glycosyltransferase involved in cell wall biosynthesis
MKFEPSSNKSHFISVGRFNDPRKGWDRLFEAYRNAYLILPSLPKLLVIGWGNFSNFDQTVLEEAQRNSPIEVYRNLDNVERDKYVRESSYFLQTSHEEGLGLAALEALQFGKPLICSETDGSKEYINDLITGKKIKQGANFVSEFCKALLESQNWDYHLMSQNAFRLFNTKFSFHLSSETLNKIINEIQ